jgi:hypothetical protein
VPVSKHLPESAFTDILNRDNLDLKKYSRFFRGENQGKADFKSGSEAGLPGFRFKGFDFDRLSVII